MSHQDATGGPLVRVRNLAVRYGPVTAVRDVSFEVGPGEIVALLGANGAGKTSTVRAVSGTARASVDGQIEVLGAAPSYGRLRHTLGRGMAMVPEGRQIIAPLTVEENLLIGAYHLRSGSRREALLREMYDLFPILEERRDGPAGLLSGGEQQMLALGRALMSDPKVVLADEPSMGLAPIMVQRTMQAIARIGERGTAVLLVEQNALAALRIASRAYVMERGCVVKSGTSEELMADTAVERTFLALGELGGEPLTPASG